MRRSSNSLLIFLASYQAALAQPDELSIRLPNQMPLWVEKLYPQLAGFSIEMDRWPDWAGSAVGKPNDYFNQLLRNLGDRTGKMPFLRVGANSEDRATVDLGVQVMKSTFPEPTESVPNPEADHIFIGRDFYALSGNLPAGTEFMWGLNLKSLNQTETVAQARLLSETFQGVRSNLTKHVKLANVELGNEPDFYGTNRRFDYQGVLGTHWDMHNYTDTWVRFARAISKEIEFGCPNCGKPTLSPGSYTGWNMPDWTLGGTLDAGLLDDWWLRGLTSQFTGHSYSGTFAGQQSVNPGDLMEKFSIRSNLTSKLEGVRAARTSGLQFIFSEINSYANHGIPGLSNTVESALWAVDWLLLGATLGVECQYFHHGIGFRYNTIQPVSNSDDGLNVSRPHILPSYYGFLIVNEAIGDSGQSYVAELTTTSSNLTAYGIWEGSQLTRAVVINSQVYLGNGEEKPSIKVQLEGLRAGGNLSMKKLRSEKTTSHTGLTWAGQSFETRSGKPEGSIEEEDIHGGSFILPASSVALLRFGDKYYV